MKRTCPNCKEKSIPAIRILIWSTKCNKCNAKIGSNQVLGFLIFIPLFMLYLFLLLWSLNKFGFIGPIIVTISWLSVEIAREAYGPLEVRVYPKNME